MTDVLENMKRTGKAVIDGYNKWEIEAIMAYRAEDSVHQVLPNSMGREPRDNESYREYFASVLPTFRNFHVWAEEEVYDTATKKAAFHMMSTADTPVGSYSNEYSIFLTMNDDGTKVVKFKEFVDSAYSQQFFGKLRAHMKKHGGNADEAWKNADGTAQA